LFIRRQDYRGLWSKKQAISLKNLIVQTSLIFSGPLLLENYATIACMNSPKLPPGLQRNILTQRLHKKQVLWQIILPLCIGIPVLFTLGILTIFSGSETVSHWADISLIFLLIPLMLMGLVISALIVGLIIGISRLMQYIPTYAHLVQQFAFLVKGRVLQRCNISVEPILFVRSTIPAIRVLFARILLAKWSPHNK